MTTVATDVVKQTDRSFYMAMAMAAVATIFVGFARTFFLRGYMALPAGQADLSPLLLTHGVVATTWIVLFAIQTSLISVRLGIAASTPRGGRRHCRHSDGRRRDTYRR